MEFFKEEYSIKDLASFSGVKAHTIRMWERRHDLLRPQRTDSNARRYDEKAFKRLMNVAFLKRNGYKISQICHLQNSDLNQLVQKNSTRPEQMKSRYIQIFKLAMMDFDEPKFESVYEELLKKFSPQAVFLDVLVPFLQNIGLLWQTQSINPSHEHFVSHWIRKKLLAQIDQAKQVGHPESRPTYVMFLPENEIHDLGLLFIYNQLIQNGYKCIYLGYSLPTQYLTDLAKRYENIYFLSYFSLHPEKPQDFLDEFHLEVGKYYSCKLWLLGKQTETIDRNKLQPYCRVFDNIPAILKEI